VRTVIRYRNGVLNGKGPLLDGFMEDSLRIDLSIDAREYAQSKFRATMATGPHSRD